MRRFGLRAIYAEPNLSLARKKHAKYPYLIRGKSINFPNQVWATDITDLKLPDGNVYLVAILDLFNRKVLSWQLSNTMDTHFCIDALNKALDKYVKPEVFNTDQGSQFTSRIFVDELEKRNIKVSMDGKGRCLDNVVVEIFWRTLKQDEVYLKDYTNMTECKDGIDSYIQKYNSFRPHSTHGGITPDMAYKAAYKAA